VFNTKKKLLDNTIIKNKILNSKIKNFILNKKIQKKEKLNITKIKKLNKLFNFNYKNKQFLLKKVKKVFRLHFLKYNLLKKKKRNQKKVLNFFKNYSITDEDYI
jgi:hypothetical protein